MSNSWWFLIGSADLCTLISENRSEDTFSHQLFMLSKFCFMNDVQKCQISKVFASFFCTEESEQTNASTAYSREMALVASSSQTKYIRWKNGVNPFSLNKTKEVKWLFVDQCFLSYVYVKLPKRQWCLNQYSQWWPKIMYIKCSQWRLKILYNITYMWSSQETMMSQPT